MSKKPVPAMSGLIAPLGKMQPAELATPSPAVTRPAKEKRLAAKPAAPGETYKLSFKVDQSRYDWLLDEVRNRKVAGQRHAGGQSVLTEAFDLFRALNDAGQLDEARALVKRRG